MVKRILVFHKELTDQIFTYQGEFISLVNDALTFTDEKTGKTFTFPLSRCKVEVLS